jgi:hypothetical protein
MKAQSSKRKAPEKIQSPNTANRSQGGCLELEAWSFFGIWSLELGAFSE